MTVTIKDQQGQIYMQGTLKYETTCDMSIAGLDCSNGIIGGVHHGTVDQLVQRTSGKTKKEAFFNLITGLIPGFSVELSDIR